MKKYYVLWFDEEKNVDIIYDEWNNVKHISRTGVTSFKTEERARVFAVSKRNAYGICSVCLSENTTDDGYMDALVKSGGKS